MDRDINRAIRVARAIETGRMWVNTYNAIPEGAFGGYKESGIGRETHKVMLEHYTQMKNIMINLSEEPTGFYPAPDRLNANHPFPFLKNAPPVC